MSKQGFDWKFIKEYFTLTLPVILQQLLTNLVNTTDNLMIGQAGEQAISAIAVSNKFFFVYSLTLFGMTNGIGIFIAQFYGAKDRSSYQKIFRFGMKAGLLVAVLVTAFMFAAPRFTMTLFVKNETVISLGLQYIRYIRLTYIPFAFISMSSVAFRVIGKPSVPLKTSAISFIINIIGNYLLITGNFGFPRLGVTGSAIATLFARLVEMITLLYLLLRQDNPLSLWERYSPLERADKRQVLNKTFPLMCNEVIWSIGLNIIFLNYCFVNEDYVPAITVADNVSQLTYIAFSGCGVAAGVFIGNALGANNLKLAKENAKKMLWTAAIILASGSLLILVSSFFAPQAFSLSRENAMLARKLFLMKGLLSWSQSYANTVYYILRSGGDTKSVLIVDGIFTWIGPVLVSTLLSRVFHINFLLLYLTVEAMGFIKVLLSFHFYRKGLWLRNLTGRSSV